MCNLSRHIHGKHTIAIINNKNLHACMFHSEFTCDPATLGSFIVATL